MWKTPGKAVLALALASAASGLTGSVVHTWLNISALEAVGSEVFNAAMDPALQREMVWHDIRHFAPLFMLMSAASFVPAFLVAGALVKLLFRHSAWKLVWYPLAGFAGVMVALLLGNLLAPMPAYIVVTRTWTGLLAMSASGAVGGLVYALLVRPKPSRGALDHVKFGN